MSVGVINVANDTYIGCAEGESEGIVDIFLPENLVHDPVSCEITMIWAFLFGQKTLNNCTVDIYVIKKQTWLCLKKSRVKDKLLLMLLHQLFWWAMERNVKLNFNYAPLY